MKKNTTNDLTDLIIGYSAFEFSEECYEYNENACYVADNPETLKQFLTNAMFDVNDYRIDTIKLSDILKGLFVKTSKIKKAKVKIKAQ